MFCICGALAKEMCSRSGVMSEEEEEFEKVSFPVFAILRKNFLGASGRGQSQRD